MEVSRYFLIESLVNLIGNDISRIGVIYKMFPLGTINKEFILIESRKEIDKLGYVKSWNHKSCAHASK